MVPSPALIVPLLVNRFPNKLLPNVPNTILRILPFGYFASFLIVSLTAFINRPNYSRDLIIFMMSFISSLEIVNVALSDPKIFLGIVTSFAAAAAVNPNGIKTFLANGLSIFFIKDNPIFGNCPKSVPKNHPDCLILWNWIFDNFILVDEHLQKLYEASKLVY